MDEVDYMAKNAQQALKYLIQSSRYNVRLNRGSEEGKGQSTESAEQKSGPRGTPLPVKNSFEPNPWALESTSSPKIIVWCTIGEVLFD